MRSFKRSRPLLIGGTIVSLWFFVCLSFDYAITKPTLLPQQQQHKAWLELEGFLSDPAICSSLLKEKKLGSSVISSDPLIDLRVGKEWRSSGFILKDIYLLSSEQEISWASSKNEQDRIFLKLTLVEKPQTQALSLSYLMSAQELTRIISIPAVIGEEFEFDDCKKSDAEGFCHEVSSVYGKKPVMRNLRTPASEKQGCGRAGGYRVVCFIPHKGGEIKSCGQNKKALANEGFKSN